MVTLAGLLAWQGALLWVLGDTGSVNLPPSVITDLTEHLLRAGGRLDPRRSPAIVAFAAAELVGAAKARRRAGSRTPPIAGTALKIGLVAAAIDRDRR